MSALCTVQRSLGTRSWLFFNYSTLTFAVAVVDQLRNGLARALVIYEVNPITSLRCEFVRIPPVPWSLGIVFWMIPYHELPSHRSRAFGASVCPEIDDPFEPALKIYSCMATWASRQCGAAALPSQHSFFFRILPYLALRAAAPPIRKYHTGNMNSNPILLRVLAYLTVVLDCRNNGTCRLCWLQHGISSFPLSTVGHSSHGPRRQIQEVVWYCGPTKASGPRLKRLGVYLNHTAGAPYPEAIGCQ